MAYPKTANLQLKSERGFLEGVKLSPTQMIKPAGDEELLVLSGDGRTEDVARAIENMISCFTTVGTKQIDLGYKASFETGNKNRKDAAEAVKEAKHGGVAVKIATVTPNRPQQRELLAEFNKNSTYFNVLYNTINSEYASRSLEEKIGKEKAEVVIEQMTTLNTTHIDLLREIDASGGKIPSGADREYLAKLLGKIEGDTVTEAKQLEQIQDEIHALVAENDSLGVDSRTESEKTDTNGKPVLFNSFGDVKRRIMTDAATVDKERIIPFEDKLKQQFLEALEGIEGESDKLQQRWGKQRGEFRLRVSDVPEALFKSPNGELRGAVESYNLQREPIPGLPLDPKQPEWKDRDFKLYTPEASAIPFASLEEKSGLTLSVNGVDEEKKLKKNDLVMVQRHDAKAVEEAARKFFSDVLHEMTTDKLVMPLISTKNTVFASDESLKAIVETVFNKEFRDDYRTVVQGLVDDGIIKQDKAKLYNQPFHQLTDDMLANIISNPEWYGKTIRLFLPDAELGNQMRPVFDALKSQGLADLSYLKAAPGQANIIHRMGVGDHYGATCGQMSADGNIEVKNGEDTLLTVKAQQNDPFIVMQNAKDGFKQWAKQTVQDAVRQGKQSVYFGLSDSEANGYYAAVKEQVSDGIKEAIKELNMDRQYMDNPVVHDPASSIHFDMPEQLFAKMLTNDGHIKNAAVALPNYLGDIYTDIAPALYGGKGGHISRLIGSTGNDILEAVHGTADSAGNNFNPIASVMLYAEALSKLGKNTNNEGIQKLGDNMQEAVRIVVNNDHILPCEVQKKTDKDAGLYSAQTADMLRAIALRTAELQEPEKSESINTSIENLKTRLADDKHYSVTTLPQQFRGF